MGMVALPDEVMDLLMDTVCRELGEVEAKQLLRPAEPGGNRAVLVHTWVQIAFVIPLPSSGTMLAAVSWWRLQDGKACSSCLYI